MCLGGSNPCGDSPHKGFRLSHLQLCYNILLKETKDGDKKQALRIDKLRARMRVCPGPIAWARGTRAHYHEGITDDKVVFVAYLSCLLRLRERGGVCYNVRRYEKKGKYEKKG